MEERKCSWTAIKEYDNAIKEYLISKNITNFNNFEISFKESKLYFNKWEYDVEKPKNLQPKQNQINYLDLYSRLLIINIKTNENYKYFNCDGDEIVDHVNYKDPHNRSIQSIYQKSRYQYRRWTNITDDSDIHIWEGKLTFAKITGTFHIFIFYRYDNSDILIRGESEKPIHAASAQYYTMPKELHEKS
jgi:hypothetical protein